MPAEDAVPSEEMMTEYLVPADASKTLIPVSSGVRILPPVCEVERDDPQTNKSSGGTVGPIDEGANVGLFVVGIVPVLEDVGFQVGQASVGAYVGNDGPGFGVVGTMGIRDDGGSVEGSEPFVGSCVGLCLVGGRGIIVGIFGIPPFVGECVGNNIIVGRGSIVGILGGNGFVGE